MRSCVLLLAAALLAAGETHAERVVRSLLEMRQENLVMQQWDISCGAAALATILTYYQAFPVSEEEVARGMLRQTDPLRVRHRGGFSLLDMKRYAAQIGFQGAGYSGMSLENLAVQAPLIVPIRVRGYNHFVVVRKSIDNEVHIADPGFGNYRMSRSKFERAWLGIGFQITKQ